jgi:hypothetical protein
MYNTCILCMYTTYIYIYTCCRRYLGLPLLLASVLVKVAVVLRRHTLQPLMMTQHIRLAFCLRSSKGCLLPPLARSGNIQGQFSLNWADAREPPSQLQEALKKSAKVDAEYNLPTWVPKTRANKTKRRIPGVELHVHPVLPRSPHSNIQGQFKERIGRV